MYRVALKNGLQQVGAESCPAQLYPRTKCRVFLHHQRAGIVKVIITMQWHHRGLRTVEVTVAMAISCGRLIQHGRLVDQKKWKNHPVSHVVMKKPVQKNWQSPAVSRADVNLCFVRSTDILSLIIVILITRLKAARCWKQVFPL